MKIYVLGSLNMDLVIHAPFMPENGVTISGSGFMTNPGGKGANQATAVGKLGGEVEMIGCVGDAFGDELISALSAARVGVSHVEKVKDVSSGTAVIVVVDGDNRIILDAGANALVGKGLIDRALSEAKPGDLLVTGLEIPQSAVAYGLSVAKAKRMLTLLNPAPAAKLDASILPLCDWFAPNQSETEFYTGIYPEDESSILGAAKALSLLGVKNVLITLGAVGSACVSGGKLLRVPAFPVKPVDTTGAGDTFIGAFAVGLAENMPLADAMSFASRASSITVTRPGAGKSIPWRDEVKDF